MSAIPPSATSLLSLKSVAELSKEHFFIPDYQRGYRWEKDQVRELLSDIADFFKSGNALYCLQPLVVIPKGDAWEVVDGQQRLTTLFLILSNLRKAESSFQICYQRHGKPLKEIMQALGDTGSGHDKPDFHYLRRADRRIKAFLRVRPEAAELFEKLNGSLEQQVSFIWYLLPTQKTSTQKASIDAFTRLNAGKIALTDVELIRALFLRGDAGLEEPERLNIATVWDQMEKRLQEEEFWGFAAPAPDVYKEPVNRIELVLHMVAGGRLEGHHQLFHAFDVRIQNLGPRAAWLEVEQAFSALEEWHDDHALFHLIGYLSNAWRSGDTSVWNLYSQYWCSEKVETKDRFKKALVALVRNDLVKGGDVKSFIEGLSYKDPAIKPLLLCFNLATLLADAHGTVRFSFHAFREQKEGSGGWDVEHIHATATGDPDGKDLDGFLKMYHHFFKTKPAECQQLLEKLTNVLDPDAKTDTHAKKELCTECREWEKKQYPGEEMQEGDDRLANLTLLDSNTNRGFKNASFRVKRAWILDPDRQHVYVPPCTRNVFTKSYTPDAADLLRWNLNAGMDGDSHVNAMVKVLTGFFNEAEPVSPSGPKPVRNGSRGGCGVRPNRKSPDCLPGRTMSFLELLELKARNGIEIPLIQRDYAQGRESAKTVRRAFLDAIFDVMEKGKQGDELNLDFVYGTISETCAFEPIDGQQRLTTLFLLHWAVFWKTEKLADFKKLLVDEKTGVFRFRYRVRPGAERFFPALLEHSVHGITSFEKELPNRIWFSRSWLNDPTVKSALVMLDAINERLEGFSPDDLADRLGRIKMEILVLPPTISPDEIYLKMNARGKPLTDFEKFKAWLVGQGFMTDDRKLRLDQEWLEFFWEKSENKKNRAGTVSACFFNTLLALAVNAQAGRAPCSDETGKKETEKEFGDRINEWTKLGQAYRVDQWEKLFDAKTVGWVFSSLDAFQNRAGEIDGMMASGDWKTKEKLVTSDPDPKLSFKDRCWLHAVTLFCHGKCGEDREWFRVARNLIANTDLSNIIYLPQTIRSLDKLAERMKEGVLAGLAALGASDMQPFLPKDFGEQLEEECTKAQLLETNAEDWKVIRAAERHSYLEGQIGVILSGASGDRTPIDAGGFAKRWETFEVLMSREKMNPCIEVDKSDPKPLERLDRLVIRAVLAKCEAIDENEVWLPWMVETRWGKALKREAGIKQFQAGLMKVIDDLIATGSHGSPGLQAKGLEHIVSSSLDSRVPWMRNLIKHGEAILRNSEDWKLKRYEHWRSQWQNAFLVFQKTIRNRYDLEDVLIGEEFDVRNELIAKLVETEWVPSGASKMRSNGRTIFSGHHPVLQRDGKKIVFFYQSIELDVAGPNDQKERVSFMDGIQPREIEDVLGDLRYHGMPV